jgi:hypothetical protein
MAMSLISRLLDDGRVITSESFLRARLAELEK